MNIVKFFMLILSINSAIVQQQPETQNDKDDQDRQLNAFYYGGYHPFYPFPQTHTQTVQTKTKDGVHEVNSQTNVMPHYPMMGPFGMSPYMGMGYMNPFLSNPDFFGMNPMYSHFLAMNYMMNPSMMNPYLMNPFNMMQGMQHTTTEEIQLPKKDEKKEEKKDEQNQGTN